MLAPLHCFFLITKITTWKTVNETNCTLQDAAAKNLEKAQECKIKLFLFYANLKIIINILNKIPTKKTWSRPKKKVLLCRDVSFFGLNVLNVPITGEDLFLFF